MSSPLVYISESIKVICELAELFGLSRPRQNLDPTIQFWNKICQERIAQLEHPLKADDEIRITIKFIKYKLAAFVAVGQQTPVPPPPFDVPSIQLDSPAALIGGRWKVYVRRYLLQGPRKWEFLSSLKHVKSALPRPGKAMARQAELDTVEKLTTVPREFTPEEETLKTFLIREIRRTVKEIFHGHRFTQEDKMRNFFPSTNSNYINTRSKFGALGVVAGVIDALDLRLNPDETLVKIKTITGESEENRAEDEEEKDLKVLYDDQQLQERYQIMMSFMTDYALSEVAQVKPVGLEEALKVRVITKGPPYTYTVLKPLQKWMHDVMRKLPIFQLLGEPDVNVGQLYSQQLDYLINDERLNSGDYNDATNEMYSWVSEVTGKAIASEIKLDKDYKELFLKALIGHNFDGVDQVHGSLMGSIVNFLVLCIANATLCRCSMEYDTGKKIPLEEARLLINGDDCLFPIGEEGRKFWIRAGSVMGLIVNNEKSFWSREFCNINSRDFTLTPSRIIPGEHVIKPVKFVHMGLLYGMKRSEAVGTEKLVDGRTTLGARARELISDAPFDMHETLMNIFILHNPELKSTTLPWHIPEWAGGVGIPDVQSEFDDIDEKPWLKVRYKRDLAGLKYALLHWDEKRPRPLTDQVTLDVHSYVMQRLRNISRHLVTKSVPRKDNVHGKLYQLLSIEWLFTSRNTMDYFTALGAGEIEGPKSTLMSNLRFNEKYWQEILQRPVLPEPDAKTWDMFKSTIHSYDYIYGEREISTEEAFL